METSLIGKALGFGSNEYRFESCVSSINYSDPYAYLINNINIQASHKTLKTTISYSRKSFSLLKILYHIGSVGNYYVFITNNKKFISIYPTYYNLLPLSKNYKILSTPSNSLIVTYKALVLLNKKTGAGFYIVSTSQGLMTHKQAIQKKIGGILIASIFV